MDNADGPTSVIGIVLKCTSPRLNPSTNSAFSPRLRRWPRAGRRTRCGARPRRLPDQLGSSGQPQLGRGGTRTPAGESSSERVRDLPPRRPRPDARSAPPSRTVGPRRRRTLRVRLGHRARAHNARHRSRTDAGLPPPRPQVPILARDGQFIGRVDFYWDEFGVVGEADGDGKLAGRPRGLIEEKRRQGRLEDAGLIVVRWGWSDLRTFDSVAAHLRAAFNRGVRPNRTPRLWQPAPWPQASAAS